MAELLQSALRRCSRRGPARIGYAHHLVPVSVLKSNEVAQAAVVGGYAFNGKTNGALLTGPEHDGRHYQWNQLITEEMNEFARTNRNYTPIH
jgi:A nuclease family of the HNH/ENDO VII superfamily with conserved AHH